jgi:GNAT superfamily N-acetyltransferase
VEAIAAWYPSIAVGNASCHLDAGFYREKVVLEDEPGRDFLVLLFKHGHELAAMLSVERDRDSEVLYGRVGVVSPEHRGMNLGDRFPSLAETMGRDMGMGMVYGLATLKFPHMQAKFERLGWQLIGIIPGFDREMVQPGVVKRVYEAIYAKVLVGDDDFLRPGYAQMTPRTAELFGLLYPGKADPG